MARKPRSRGFVWAVSVCWVAMIAGCATSEDMSQMDAAPVDPGTMVWQTLQQTAQCVTDVENRPAFAALKLRTPDDYDAPAAQPLMTSPDLASIEERRQIQGFREAITACRPSFGPIPDPALAARASEIQRIWDRQQELYTFLQSGSLPWGRFNRETQANSEQLLAVVRTVAPRPIQIAQTPEQSTTTRTRGLTIGGGEPTAVPALPPGDQSPSPSPATPPAPTMTMAPMADEGTPAMADAAPNRAPPSQAAPQPPAPPTVSSPSAPGRFRVHLASYRREADAERGWTVLSQRAPTLMQRLAPSTTVVDIPGRGRFVRLYGGAFATKAAAEAACFDLRRALGYCQLLPET